MCEKIFVAYALKIVSLASTQDRDGDFVRIGRCEDKDDVCRWLFERFEQGIKSLGREHVDFVDDVYFVAVARWSIAHSFENFADFINTAIRSAVDFDDVERTALGNFSTTLARITRLFAWGMFTVERFGKDARRRRLANTTRARK